MTLAEQFLKDRGDKKIGLMTHLVCGYPGFNSNDAVLEQMSDAGVEIVEFQFPFSEPVADGPLFAQANQISIDNGTKVEDCFRLMEKAAAKYAFQPLMMGYYNPVFKMTEDLFCKRLADVGGRGLIIPDLPIEESSDLREACDNYKLEVIDLVTPKTTDAQLAKIGGLVNKNTGLVYVVARKGTTGKHSDFDQGLESYIKRVKTHITAPLAVGFGVSSREDIQSLEGLVDCAVLGTKVLKVHESEGVEAVGQFLKGLRS
jgi:tryptophan synthase alpha chain